MKLSIERDLSEDNNSYIELVCGKSLINVFFDVVKIEDKRLYIKKRHHLGFLENVGLILISDTQFKDEFELTEFLLENEVEIVA
jgi:hypothetical protein